MKYSFSAFVLLVLVVTGAVNAHSIETLQIDKTSKTLKEEIRNINYGERGWRLNIKLSQRADVWDSRLENSFRYRVYFEPDYDVKLSESFYFRIKTGLGTTIGSVQSRFGDLRADDAIILRDSRFYFREEWNKKRHALKLSIGALDQASYMNSYGMGILVSRRALPGLEQIYKFESKQAEAKSYGFDLRSFQGIPTSQSLTLNFNEKEDTPFYYNAKAEVFIKDMKVDFGYRLSLSGGVFNFSPLPSIIASESSIYGNQVLNGQTANAEFIYDYKGWFAGWKADVSFNQTWSFNASIDILTNTEAPSGRNQGQVIGAKIKYSDQSLYSLTAEGFTFFNESDSSVASYNGSTAGHNNREGYGMNIALELPRRGLKLKLQYVNTDILENENFDLQIPYQYFGFRMEYKYEL